MWLGNSVGTEAENDVLASLFTDAMHHFMRTTLTIDPDVAERLRQELAIGRRSFKQIVNECLRVGFGLKMVKPKCKFRIQPHSSRYVPGVDRLKLNQLVDELDAENFNAGRHKPAPR